MSGVDGRVAEWQGGSRGTGHGLQGGGYQGACVFEGGRGVGTLASPIVGNSVGALVGSAVGSSVGGLVGWLGGWVVGWGVGSGVGMVVGEGVGIAVGVAVIGRHSWPLWGAVQPLAHQ